MFVRLIRFVPMLSAALIAALCLGPVPVRAARRGPYLQNLQKDRITVCWETPQPQSGEVRLADAEGRRIKAFPTTQPATRHEVVVDGVETGRQYAYEVVLGENALPLGNGRFRSMPAQGQPLTFAVWGDSREGAKTSAALSPLMLKANVGMVVHTGDLVSDGKQLHQWDKDLFGPCAELMRNAVLWPAVGNHDTGTKRGESVSVFESVFALPGKETYYSFDYGDAHFLVLDTTSPLQAQARFAEQDLAGTQAKWRFAAFHHPPFSSSVHPSHVQCREQILPILARHNVDMILVGHNHNYMLSKPIRHVYEPRQQRPYVQLVTGGGGAYPADFDSNDRWFEHAVTVYHYVLIHIDGDKLEAKAINPAGRVLHRFSVDKSPRDAVAFELIELERYLAELDNTNTNMAGWPTGLVISPREPAGKLMYKIRNPLKEPLKLQIDCGQASAGLKFEPAIKEIEVPAGKQVDVEASFRVTAPDKLYPMKGPAFSFACGLGKGRVLASEPPMALGREVIARRVDETIAIDGEAKEPTWNKAPEHGQFVRWAVADLAYQPAAQATTVRAMHDGKNLYVLLHRPATPSASSQPGQIPETDGLTVYIASPDKALGIKARANGRHDFEGTRWLEAGVVAAHSPRKDGLTWEISVPLAPFGSNLAAGTPIAFNVMDTRGKDVYTFVATFRQHFSRGNSARLVLE